MGAMTLSREHLTDAIHVSLELGVVVNAVLSQNHAVKALPLLDFLGFADGHEVAFPGDRIGRATRQAGQQQRHYCLE